MESIGKRIQKYRRQSNLSQHQLAQRLNISRQNISKWENDLSLPDVEMLKKIAEVFQITINDLIETTTVTNSSYDIYNQAQSVLSNIQKENKKKNKIQLCLIVLCIICLVYSIITNIELNKRVSSLTQFMNNKSVESSSSLTHKTIESQLLVTDNPNPWNSYLSVNGYSITNQEVLVQFQFVLKEYTPDTMLSLEFFSDYAELIHVSYPVEKVDENKYQLVATLPFHNFDTVNLIITNGDEIKTENIGKNGICQFVNHFLSEQVYLKIPYNNLGQRQLNIIEYFPDFSQDIGHTAKYNGQLKGTISIQIFDTNYNAVTENITLNLDEIQTIELDKKLPTNENLIIRYAYTIDMNDLKIFPSMGVITKEFRIDEEPLFSVSDYSIFSRLPKIY